MRGNKSIRLPIGIVLCGLLATLAPAGVARAAEVAEFEWACPAQPWVPETLSWPATLLVVRSELGKVSGQEQTFKVVARIANGSYDDLRVTVTASLLDGDGNRLGGETETDGTGEAEINVFSFRIDLPLEQGRAVEKCRLEVSGQPK